jgi:DNA polymerase III psi subunit
LENNALTLNERLYHSGLMQVYDKALIYNKPLAVEILKALKVDSKSIEQIVYTK